jgi:hypothetical protein
LVALSSLLSRYVNGESTLLTLAALFLAGFYTTHGMASREGDGAGQGGTQEEQVERRRSVRGKRSENLERSGMQFSEQESHEKRMVG